ncbi:MAG: diguanylate cyclase, partial [Chloroflexota bacterium]
NHVFLFLVVAVVSGVMAAQLNRERALALARAAEAEALHSMTAEMAASLDIRRVCELVVSQAGTAVRAERGLLLRVSESGFLVAGQMGADDHNPTAITELAAALRDNAPILTEDGHALAARINGGPSGGLVLWLRRPLLAFNEEDLLAVSSLLVVGASAVSNAFRYEERSQQASVDPLTGLFNRREFEGQLERQVGHSQRTSEVFSLLLVDLDQFKSINDTHGHQVGDQALRETAALVRASVRTQDLVARYGGDELTLILPGCGADAAREAGDRLLKAVRQASVPDRAGPKVTLSIGCATYPAQASDAASLIRSADAALYEAKSAGRDCFVLSFPIGTGTRRRRSSDIEPGLARPKRPADTPALSLVSAQNGRQSQKVLLIDDDARARELMRDCLSDLDCEIVEASDGLEGIRAVDRLHPDLVLLDVNMPGLDGWAVCRRIKSLPRGRLTPVVMVSALNDVTARVNGLAAGADDILAKPYAIAELRERARSRLEARAFYNTLDGLDTFLLALVRALDARMPLARSHSTRVGELTRAMGPILGFTDEGLDDLFRAGLAHDIGKIGIPDFILANLSSLTEAEAATLRSHPDIGAELLGPLARSASLVPGVRHHHERWDGSGYPDRLTGEEIPLAARIVAVCDSWDTMTSDGGPSRSALNAQEAAVELRAGAGTRWDPAVVEAFLESVLGAVAATAGSNLALPAVALAGSGERRLRVGLAPG